MACSTSSIRRCALSRWPDEDERTRLVFIVKDTEPRLIEDLFRAFTDQITGAGAFHTDKTLSLELKEKAMAQSSTD